MTTLPPEGLFAEGFVRATLGMDSLQDSDRRLFLSSQGLRKWRPQYFELEPSLPEQLDQLRKTVGAVWRGEKRAVTQTILVPVEIETMSEEQVDRP